MRIDENVSLKEHSSYRIGGNARFFAEARDADALCQAIAFARERRLPHFVLGGGTNLLISDDGFDGVVVKPALRLLASDDVQVRAGAGVPVPVLLEFAIENGLSGLEWAGGLPGTVGGAVRGNAGAFGGETKDVIAEVVSMDISGETPRTIRRAKGECAFGYRTSIFKMYSRKEVILEATFALKKGDKKAVRDAIEEKIRYRTERHPMEYPNIGSIFKNVPLEHISLLLNKEFAPVAKQDPFPVVPTAHIISKAGLKGAQHGGAVVSEKHPNFIVNAGEAKASDVKTLIQLVKRMVLEKYEIVLEEEIIYV